MRAIVQKFVKVVASTLEPLGRTIAPLSLAGKVKTMFMVVQSPNPFCRYANELNAIGAPNIIKLAGRLASFPLIA
jgi:hypothetical protein